MTFREQGAVHKLNGVNDDLSESYYKTSLNPPGDSIGFMLLVRDGYLICFEGHTLGNVRCPD